MKIGFLSSNKVCRAGGAIAGDYDLSESEYRHIRCRQGIHSGNDVLQHGTTLLELRKPIFIPG